MRIVFVTYSFAIKAGIERTLIDKANFLAKEGNEVFLVTYEQGQHPISFNLYPSVRHIDLDCRVFTLHKYPLIIRYCRLYLMKRRFKKRYKVFVNDVCPDVITTTSNSVALMNEILSVRKSCPVVIESHIVYTAQMDTSSIIKRLLWRYNLSVYRRCDLFVTLTEGDAFYWRKHIHNVRKIDNPVTCYVENIGNVEKERGRIIAVGRLNNHQKRFDRLIDAFSLISKKYPEWHMDIFGEGYLRESLEIQIRKLGLENKIKIRKPVSDIYSEYLKSELFVLSSDYEGRPLVLIEAMACGLSSVSTNCPYGPSEIIEDGVTGLLSKMDVQDLANKMEWMITHEKERHEIGKNGHSSVAKYKLEHVMKDWLEAYTSVKK